MYTNSETGVAELEISFNIVSEHEEDEGENCFILEILNIRKFLIRKKINPFIRKLYGGIDKKKINEKN